MLRRWRHRLPKQFFSIRKCFFFSHSHFSKRNRSNRHIQRECYLIYLIIFFIALDSLTHSTLPFSLRFCLSAESFLTFTALASLPFGEIGRRGCAFSFISSSNSRTTYYCMCCWAQQRFCRRHNRRSHRRRRRRTHKNKHHRCYQNILNGLWMWSRLLHHLSRFGLEPLRKSLGYANLLFGWFHVFSSRFSPIAQQQHIHRSIHPSIHRCAYSIDTFDCCCLSAVAHVVATAAVVYTCVLFMCQMCAQRHYAIDILLKISVRRWLQNLQEIVEFLL